MASTGEVGCIGSDMEEAPLAALRSVGFEMGKKTVLISAGPPEGKSGWLPVLKELKGLDYRFYATSGTARFMRKNGFDTETLRWPLDGGSPNCTDFVRSGKIGLVINIPKNNEEVELSNDYLIRRESVDNGVPLLTNLSLTKRLFESLSIHDFHDLPVREWREI